MSTLLLVFIPLALLAVVLLLCFVGCDVVFGLQQLDKPFRRYSPSILDEPTLVAYWPLGEPAGATTTTELKGGRHGAYLSQPFPDDPTIPSASAPGTLLLGRPGIVQGDIVPPHDASNARTTCIEVNGGYVSVPFDPALNPTKAEGFSIEAWLRVEWSAADPAAVRAVMVSFDTAGALKGFALITSPDNIWQTFVGAGANVTVVNGPDVVFDTTNHVVVTYDGTLLRFFLNGSQSSAVAADYQPSTESRLLIGAGGPHLPEPRAPWVGKLQCVALYRGPLSLEQVTRHFHHGNGVATE